MNSHHIDHNSNSGQDWNVQLYNDIYTNGLIPISGEEKLQNMS